MWFLLFQDFWDSEKILQSICFSCFPITIPIPIWFYSSLASVMTNKFPYKNLLENKENKAFGFKFITKLESSTV